MTDEPAATVSDPPAPGGTPSVADVTRRLVAASSQNPGEDERAVAYVVEELCAELRLPAPRRLGEPERPNLVIELEFGPGGRTVALCGHLDTKPVGEGAWETDPLTATLVGDELRGRGVVDMKGAIAAMLLAAADLTTDPPPRGRLELLLCADEEHGAVFGARWLADHAALAADAMVIGEPGGLDADWDRLHLGSRGICNFDIEVVTEQGHSSLRDRLGLVSATEVAARLVVALRDRFVPPFPDDQPWRPTVTPGVVLHGGITYGVLPGRAFVGSECRLVPGMERDGFEAALRSFVEAAVPDGAAAAVTIRDWIPAATTDPAHPLVAAARDTLRELRGQVPPDDLFPGTTDASWLARDGLACLPALGPGLLRHAHAPDERVRVPELDAARAVYRRLVHRYLGAAA